MSPLTSIRALSEHATDEELVKLLVAHDDREAFGVLFDRHSPAVLSRAMFLLRDKEDALDVTQLVFAETLQAVLDGKWTPGGSFRGWVLARAKHRAVNHLVRTRSRDPQDLTDDLPDDTPTPERAAVDAEHRRILHDSIRSLPPKQRLVVESYVYGELAVPAIGKRLDITPSTVRQHIFQAKKKIMQFIACSHSEYGQ